MYDIHTHLYWDSYDQDRDEVLRRAKEAGVEKMLVIGCTVEESAQAVKLAEKYPELLASVGVHPHEFREAKDLEHFVSGLEELKKLAENPNVVAIGECGLDYFVRSKNDDSKQVYIGRTSTAFSEEIKTIQKEGFREQIDLAASLQKPMIIHCRDAYGDMFDILSARHSEVPAFILHCYMGDTEVTQKFLTLPNVSFSFTGNITYPMKKAVAGTKDDLTETVKLVPLNRIFAETDCPFLAPQEHRGERNEPAFVVAVAEKIAELHGETVEVVEKATKMNFAKVFGGV
ncbi:MAG: TatD family hydrolase [Candidatus Moraniibacteriota bacterium]